MSVIRPSIYWKIFYKWTVGTYCKSLIKLEMEMNLFFSNPDWKCKWGTGRKSIMVESRFGERKLKNSTSRHKSKCTWCTCVILSATVLRNNKVKVYLFRLDQLKTTCLQSQSIHYLVLYIYISQTKQIIYIYSASYAITSVYSNCGN